jgi:hypothetical protein
VRRERLQSALNTLKRLVEGLSPKDYGQVDRPRRLLPMKDYSFILFQMVQHVREYGPRKFSRAGIDSGVADILIAFGLEHGQPATVAFRLQNGCPSLCCILHRTAPSITLPNIFILPWPV